MVIHLIKKLGKVSIIPCLNQHTFICLFHYSSTHVFSVYACVCVLSMVVHLTKEVQQGLSNDLLNRH